jgi:hypothetical protein
MEMKKMSKKNDEKTDEEVVIRSKVSSAYTRHVGTIRIDVINTTQNDVSKKASQQKWAVLVDDTNNKKAAKLHSGHAKKSDAIASLRAHEIVLKAADKS